MKTTNSRDSLDSKIDDLLASYTLQPSDDFVARVLAAADELPAKKHTSPVGPLLRFALPIAALIVFAFTLAQFMLTKPSIAAAPAPSAADMQEIFLLEEGLTGLSQLKYEQFSSTNLLNTLDALTFDIES
ncbi:MAG: hypothetical protein HOO08_01990 [Opitutae bacterium]|jgi:hypothetical protein|nr:hypothetical protein [Opitutae bacterium]